MRYNGTIKSTESVTIAVVKLPKYMRSKFYQHFEGNLYNETTYNLEVSVRWLGSKLNETYNPIAVVNESEKRKEL